MNISEMSVRRPVTVLVLTLLIMGLALFMVPDLAVEMFPSTTWPVISISTSYYGASPEEVEDRITSRLEQQVSNVSGLENVTSTSSEGSSNIRLEFDYGVDLDEATVEVRDSLDRVLASLPDGAGTPRIRKFNSSGRSMMRLILTGDESSDTLTRLGEETVQPLLERIDGVASAEVTGGETKEILVDVSLNRLEAYELSLQQLNSALAGQNVLVSGGKLEKAGMEYQLRVNERYASVDEIRRTVITRLKAVSSDSSVNRSNVVRLEDVANVSLQSDDSGRRVYINGVPSVNIRIMNESGTNTVQIAEEIRTLIPEINKRLPMGVEVKVLRDDTTMIAAIMNQVYKSAIQGGILAMLVLLFFLRNIKSTLVIGVSIPVSLLITLGAMYFFDLTLNMISLTGLILGLGMIVDNSIVILENIYKYRERGAKLHASALLGTREMVTAIVASTFTTLCVFIPLIIWKNNLEWIGQVFQDMIFTVVISLISSLVVALMLVPALSSKYLKLYSRTQKPLKNKVLKTLDRIFEIPLQGLEKAYGKALDFALRNRLMVLTLVAVLFMLSVSQYFRLGLQLQPRSSSDDSISLSCTLPIGSSVDRTEAVLQEMRRIIENEIEGYENLIVTAGSGGWGNSSSHKGSIEITLPSIKDQIDGPEEIKAKLQPFLKQFPDTVFEFSSGRRWGGGGSAVDIQVISSDLVLAGETAAEIRDILLENPQVKDPLSSLEGGAPEYRIVIDKDRAAAFGLSVTQVASAVKSFVDGSTPVSYWLNGEELNVQVQLQEEDRNSIPYLESLFILSSGERVPLSNLAHFEPARGPEDIDREEGKRIVHVTADVAEGEVATVVNEQIRQQLQNHYVVPQGVELRFSGEAQDVDRLGDPLKLVMLVAIIMVFAVMASLFESFVDPFIILFSIPLLLIGVIGVYTLLGQPLSMFSIVGMVVLVGIVVNNGIVLVDYTNLLRHKGVPLMDACRQAAESRLRPVLMTSLTTILGMVPLGFFPAEGTEAIQAIGQTIVGGLVASTFLTLFVTPILYSLLNRSRSRFRSSEKTSRRLEVQA